MQSLILTIDQDLNVIQHDQVLKASFVDKDINGRSLIELAADYREFSGILKAIDAIEQAGGNEILLEPFFNELYYGLIKGFADTSFLSEKIRFIVSRSLIHSQKYYFVLAEYTDKLARHIQLLEAREKLTLEAVNVLRDISRMVLNEPSSKLAAKKCLEQICGLFHAHTSSFRTFSRGRADIYASYGLPYGYLGRNAQIATDHIPVFKRVIAEKVTVIDTDVSGALGPLYNDMKEFTALEMIAVIPIVKKDSVIGILTLTFEKADPVIELCAGIMENVVHELDFVLERNEYYSEILSTTDQLKKLSLDIVTSLSKSIETRDPYTKGHSNRVAIYAVEIARALGWDDYELERLRVAGILHDIGKVGIPDAILLKPTPLNKYEYEIMKLHPELSSTIVSKIENFQDLVPWVRYHHEYFDGSGYPFGLKGNEIPKAARILSVADAFDAMTSDRPYRKALPLTETIEILRAGSGLQWDPEIIETAMATLVDLPREVRAAGGIPEKLDEYRRIIFNISLLSGLYLYEYVYDEAERYHEAGKSFSLGMISLKESLQHLGVSQRKRVMNHLIDTAKNELHYPVMLSRTGYYQLLVFSPLLDDNFLKNRIRKLQLHFFERNDLTFSTNFVSYDGGSITVNELFDTLLHRPAGRENGQVFRAASGPLLDDEIS